MKTTKCLIILMLFIQLSAAVSAKASAERVLMLQDATSLNLKGELVGFDPIKTGKHTVLVMLGQECPISRRMIPRLNELALIAGEKDVTFYGVLADDWITPESVAEFKNDYEISFELLLDPHAIIAKQLKPIAKPEAFVVNKSGLLAYRGRIDNRFENIGKLRNHFDQHNLLDAMNAVFEGKLPEVTQTSPVGCAYQQW